jgi:uncharacterized coiled-coil protein SlyX
MELPYIQSGYGSKPPAMADFMMTTLLNRIQRLEQNATYQQQEDILLRQRLTAMEQTVNQQADNAMAIMERLKAGAYSGRSEQMFADCMRAWS